MNPPTVICAGCSATVIRAEILAGEASCPVELQPIPAPDGGFVLALRSPSVIASAFDPAQHADRRRWSPHECPGPPSQDTFVALDFETADPKRDSACALAMVRVEAGRITRREGWLIRPPRSQFTTSWVHGIEWRHVKSSPSFAEVWSKASELLVGADYINAFNVGFDRSVVRACCSAAEIAPPAQPWLCSLAVAKSTWSLASYVLSDVAQHLGHKVDHHSAGWDAEESALVLLAAQREHGARWHWMKHADARAAI